MFAGTISLQEMTPPVSSKQGYKFEYTLLGSLSMYFLGHRSNRGELRCKGADDGFCIHERSISSTILFCSPGYIQLLSSWFFTIQTHTDKFELLCSFSVTHIQQVSTFSMSSPSLNLRLLFCGATLVEHSHIQHHSPTLALAFHSMPIGWPVQ